MRTIKNWFIVELAELNLVFRSGEMDRYEPILWIFLDQNVAVTKRGCYKLGLCDKVWEKSFGFKHLTQYK